MSLASSELLNIISKTMPFGKYSGRPLLKLPMAYLCWLERGGWPPGVLGTELALVYELKLNGVDLPLYQLLKPSPSGNRQR
ncbi:MULTISPECIES: putative quorum-sensing-regulated virulence factor [Oceanisphaera]|uniref:Quorum-sensing-regulated virulence factor n=1 Tax=Oceanisphaera ostreae TaxID=914151 RepID=A0ABW3KH21_9GAMM